MVVALDKTFPGKLGVTGLGRGGGEVEAQGVGVVAAQKIGYIHGAAAALGELGALEIHVFVDTGGKNPSF
jgi:hypothetical protein